jgi:tungstate transport system substrate-binding protein
MRVMKRRALILGLLGSAASLPLHAQRKPGDSALMLGLEALLFDCGFAAALRRRFGLDTGLALRTEPGMSSALLPALARGEIDIAITHAPALAADLEAEGSIFDAHGVATSEFLLVGPGPPAIDERHDAPRMLAAIAHAGISFVTRNDGSGTHLAEQALWRAAGIAPAAPWYRPMDPGGAPLLEQARAAGACCLVDRASWLAWGRRRDLAPWVEGDARLATVFRSHRSLLAPHPAGKLLVAWLGGRNGRALVARTPGLRAPSAAA